MAKGSNGQFLPDLVQHPTLSIKTPRRVAADANGTAYDTELATVLEGQLNVHAFLETALTGSNNDIAFVQRTPGAATVSIVLADPAANSASLSVTVSGSVITVHLATNGSGTITSTAASVIAAIRAKASAWALVHAENKVGNDGTGVVTALTSTPLADVTGTLPTLDVYCETTVDNFSHALAVSSFAQVTAVADTAKQKVFGPLASRARWRYDVGGTNPVFWVTIDAQYRPR